MALFEGKELEGKIGEYGTYSIDIDDKFMVTGDVSLKLDLVAEIYHLTEKSSSDILKKGVSALVGFLGRTDLTTAAVAAPQA